MSSNCTLPWKNWGMTLFMLSDSGSIIVWFFCCILSFVTPFVFPPLTKQRRNIKHFALYNIFSSIVATIICLYRIWMIIMYYYLQHSHISLTSPTEQSTNKPQYTTHALAISNIWNCLLSA